MIKEGYKAYKLAKTYRAYSKSTDEVEKQKLAKLLTGVLESEGGLFLKMAQYLGTKKEQAQEIQDLSVTREQVLDLDIFKNLLSDALGKDWSDVFTEIDEKAYSASIGQVHKGILKTDTGINEVVAIKVQYPGIQEKLKEQMKLLNLIPTKTPERKWGVDINKYKEMINNLLINELDYKKELSKQKQAYHLFQNEKYLCVPKVYEELSCESVLVGEFIEGVSVNEIIYWTDKEKVSLAKNLVKTFVLMLKKGMFQADSNHGNFIFKRKEMQVGIIDFGQFIQLDEKFTNGVLSLIYKMIKNEKMAYAGYLVDLGFDANKLGNIKSSLEVISKIIFEPFIRNHPYDLETWQYKKKIDLCLGDKKWWFRSAGGEEFFLLMKSFMGVKNLIEKLEVNINWQECFLEVVADIESDLAQYEVADQEMDDDQYMGDHVNILVIENGAEKVKITLPINILFNLKDTIDEETVLILEQQGIDVDLLARKALESGAKVQKIFEINKENKQVIVQII